jgi:PAS domain S-box-containing protein
MEVERRAEFAPSVPEGGSAGPVELTAEHLAQFASQFSSFNEVIDELRDSYRSLSERYASLQAELETANSRLRDALQEQAAASGYLQSILASISSGVVAVDLQGRITHFNAAAEEIYGLSAESVLGRPYSDVLPLEPPNAEAALKGVHAVQAGEKFYADPSGSVRPLAVATSLLTDTLGVVQGAVEIVTDMTRLRSLESEIMRVKTLAALGEMAATVAHEVRNPLGGIAGFAGLLAREFEEGDPRRASAEKIIRGCGNLNRIVTNLLEYARPLRLERRFCDLKAELAEEISVFESDIRRRQRALTVRREFTPGQVELFADPAQLRFALHNLLTNAADAAGDGEVVCGIDIDQDGNGRPHVRVWVSDNGPGVAETNREQIFTPFFTTKDKGTGLGLAMVRKVADAHRGTVTLGTPPGGGAQFTLTLPLS